MSIPYADHPWDEIIPGLWMGGHEYHREGSRDLSHARVTEQDPFTVVYSIKEVDPGPRGILDARTSYGPPAGREHHTLIYPDGHLSRGIREELGLFADQINGQLKAGDQVLVRCRAGYNRSGLLIGMVMIRRGWAWTEAVAHIKRHRSPYALINEHFRRYLAAEDKRWGEEQDHKADELVHFAGGDDNVR